MLLLVHMTLMKAQAVRGIIPAAVAAEGTVAVFDNQAGLAKEKHASLSCFAENPYLLKELGSQGFALILPVKIAVVCLSYRRYGYALFLQEKTGFSLSRQFGRLLSAAVQLDHLGTQMGDVYGSRQAFAFEAGIHCRLQKDLLLAGHIFNLNHARIVAYNDERYPVVSRFGLAYTPGTLQARIELSKNVFSPPELIMGLDCQIQGKAKIWTGFCPRPMMFCFGFSLRFGGINTLFASEWDPLLGCSPGIGLEYELTKPKDDKK
jgi:hypothetical protein